MPNSQSIYQEQWP